MNKQDFNIKCAEYMGINIDEYEDIDNDGLPCCLYNPYEDANDRNKVIEKMRINTNDYRNQEWECSTSPRPDTIETIEYDFSMEDAQIACISAVLQGKEND